MQTISACATASIANSRNRPTYAWRTVIPATPSASTSVLKITMSTNAPIQSERLVNSAAIAEP